MAKLEMGRCLGIAFFLTVGCGKPPKAPERVSHEEALKNQISSTAVEEGMKPQIHQKVDAPQGEAAATGQTPASSPVTAEAVPMSTAVAVETPVVTPSPTPTAPPANRVIGEIKVSSFVTSSEPEDKIYLNDGDLNTSWVSKSSGEDPKPFVEMDFGQIRTLVHVKLKINMISPGYQIDSLGSDNAWMPILTGLKSTDFTLKTITFQNDVLTNKLRLYFPTPNGERAQVFEVQAFGVTQ